MRIFVLFEKSKGCLRVEVRHVVRMIKGWGARGCIVSVMVSERYKPV